MIGKLRFNKIFWGCLILQIIVISQVYAAVTSRPIVPVYECHRINSQMAIDGMLNDPAWDKAQVIDRFFDPMTFKPVVSKTEVRLLWDDNYLYVGFKAYDTDIWSLLTERDSATCNEDCLEIFLKPNERSSEYWNFEVNAIGTIYDAFDVKRYAGGTLAHRWYKWNCEGLKTAISVNGTLNNYKDTDNYWQMEMAIPIAELQFPGNKLPQAGDTWKFHAARYDYSVQLPKGLELSSCARLTKVDFHDAVEWCKLKFIN